MDTQHDFPNMPTYDEEVAERWAAVLVYVAAQAGAPSFAADLARHGYIKANLMADRWEDWDLEPRSFAHYLRDFGATVEGLVGRL